MTEPFEVALPITLTPENAIENKQHTDLVLILTLAICRRAFRLGKDKSTQKREDSSTRDMDSNSRSMNIYR